jgi:hypothetical protein
MTPARDEDEPVEATTGDDAARPAVGATSAWSTLHDFGGAVVAGTPALVETSALLAVATRLIMP